MVPEAGADATLTSDREPAVDRMLIRFGVRDDVARIISATPSLRSSWLLAALGITWFAVWGGNDDPRFVGLVAILAPILPVAGVAAAYGPWADPMFEMTQASPTSGFRVVLVRSIAVLASAAVLIGLAAVLDPGTGVDAIAWVLPSLALCSASLMLSTFIPLVPAAGLVATAWLVVAAIVAASQSTAALFRGPAQLAFCGIVIASSLVVARRRDHLEITNLNARRALVDAADAERRRIERNIHDGAQQQLVAIGVKADLARGLVTTNPAKAVEIIDQLRADADAALNGLRDMTRGTYPPILADAGIATALEAKATSAGLPMTLDADVGRLPKQVEIAAYYCCSEAMQNAAKHAHASAIRISVRLQPGVLRLQIADDGDGFDPLTVRRGIGMRSMNERVEALGGTLDVRSAPGAGTEITALIPVG